MPLPPAGAASPAKDATTGEGATPTTSHRRESRGALASGDKHGKDASDHLSSSGAAGPSTVDGMAAGPSTVDGMASSPPAASGVTTSPPAAGGVTTGPPAAGGAGAGSASGVTTASPAAAAPASPTGVASGVTSAPPSGAAPATGIAASASPGAGTGLGMGASFGSGERPTASEVAVERPPFVPPGATPPEPPAATGPAEPAPRSGKRVVLAAGVAVAIAAIGTAAYFGYQTYNTGGKPVTMPDPLPSVDVRLPEEPTETASPEPSPAVTTVLDSAKTDPKKLTLKEAFARRRVTIGGRAYTRAKVDITARCDKVAVSTFATALKRQKCTRVLRATYVDNKRRYAVTTGIAVFPTKQAAVAADKRKNLAKTVWFRGLAGGTGTGTDKADISGGYAAGLVWGRYIVFSFATYSDGHTPGGQEKDLGPVSGAFRDYTARVIEKRVTD
ncbi:hypothetical protein [Sphaerisporangium dianthi]|uniref:Serine/threonine protein kinase n=1 Tax=Sphaerisporangium dianthi TaxID=1436120 RepID=A0ABV9CS13_9ACTN